MDVAFSPEVELEALIVFVADFLPFLLAFVVSSLVVVEIVVVE